MTTQLDAEVDALATKLASLPPLGLAAIKQMIRTTWQRTLDEELDLQRDEMRRLGFTEDYREGVAAFLEKRPPTFDWVADQLGEFAEVDVAARDDADDRPLAGLAAQRRGQRQRAGAFGDDPRLFGHQPHRARASRRARQ